MKSLLTLLFLFPLLATANSGANSALRAALIGSTIGGVTTGTQYSIYQSLMLTELDGWKNKQTDSTVALESQCDVQIEMHLIGDHRTNYVLFGISNTTSQAAIINTKEIEFVFNDGLSRFPGWKSDPSDIELKSGWWVLNYIPFPSKDEFSHYENLEVKVPLLFPGSPACVVSAKFKKHKKILREEMSYTIMDINFEGGPSLAQNGPVKFLGRPDSMFGLSFNLFPRPNHGFGFVLLGESTFKHSKNTKIQNEFSKGADYQANTTFMGLNYIYRHFLNKRLSLSYEPALGVQIIRDNRSHNDDDSKKTISDSFAILQKLMISWTFARTQAPNYQALDFNVGAGLVQIWVPGSRVNGQNLNGERYGALLRFGMGF